MLFEGRPSIYLLLTALAAGFLLAWYKDQRKKKLLYGVAAVLLATLLYTALDWAVETPYEQVKRTVQEIAAGVSRNDLDATFRHISEQFKSPGGAGKSEFRNLARRHRDAAEVTEIVVWDFFPLEPFDPAKGPGKLSFLVKVRGDLGRTQHLFARCEALFEHHPPEGWQLRSFELFDPARENERVPFPH